MRGAGASSAVLAIGLLGAVAHGIDLDVSSESSIKQTASTIAYGLMKYYTGNNTGDVPGNLPDPYYWWEAGAMFGTLIDYWHLTGDSTYNKATTQALLHQASDTKDFMPLNQTQSEGNDDQGFWAMAAMSAAENVFPNPPSDGPQWLALAQAVFNEYTLRWDETTCGGGLHWQIFRLNTGYDYKNSVSNGCFFNVAARLARYTDNSTYSAWATKIFEWEQTVGLISDDFEVYDGTHITSANKCTSVDTNMWSYNSGIFLHGAAVMYNLTESDTWKTRVDGLLSVTQKKFFKNGVTYEQFCETSKVCDVDQQSFKGYLARFLAATGKMATHTAATIKPLLETNAAAAAAACIGSPASGFSGVAGTACGFSWLTQGKFDGLVGVGEQMNALSAVMYPLAVDVAAPVTNSSGGTSTGDYNAGTADSDKTTLSKITTGDRVGAGFVTVMLVGGAIGGTAFLLT